jgi:hypothetical protein
LGGGEGGLLLLEVLLSLCSCTLELSYLFSRQLGKLMELSMISFDEPNRLVHLDNPSLSSLS